MIYSTELANKIIVNNNSKYLDAGIHENVQLVSAKVDRSVNGNIFLEIRFEKDGQELVQTEWESTKLPGMSDEEHQARGNRQVKRLLQILGCFYPKEALVFTGTSYAEFINWVKDLVNAADKTKLVKVKVVYNKKGYTTLPSYCKFTFIEPMVLPEGEESKIVELGIDQFTRPILADTEKTVDNPLVGATEATPEDLPF